MTRNQIIVRRSLAVLLATAVSGFAVALAACEKETSKSKTTTTKTTQTPEGTKKTTETTEKTVETEKKTPPPP
jgi:hypothetical protein